MKKCESVTAKADETKMKALAVFQGAKREAAALKSIVTIRMNETFSCLTCFNQKLIFCSEIGTMINTVKRRGEDEIGTIFLKSDIYSVLASSIIILYTSYITPVYFTLNLFTKHNVIFNI